ncbi:MAG: PqqD family peptide modification chaperone [Erysipelotrichaceae bacterium]|nr:PqqD family peptide modification chaperone [Erysipelotrichaceae bacterium]
MNNFEILNYFQRKAQETSTLFQVEIDVTKRCNANCLFCFQGSQHHYDDKLSFNEIVNLLDDLRELGVYSIGFSGGEPYMKKYVISKTVSFGCVQDETIVYNSLTLKNYMLNSTGTEVWNLIYKGISYDDIILELEKKYKSDEIRQNVNELLIELEKKGLIYACIE